jgi:hypothetical protein
MLKEKAYSLEGAVICQNSVPPWNSDIPLFLTVTLNYRRLKPAGSSGSPTTGANPYVPTDSVVLTQFLSNLKDGASLLYEQ